MAPEKEGDVPVRQVNHILRNLRGEHFRRTRNVQGKTVSSASFSSPAHNQPTLPIDLIYPSRLPAPSPSRAPGPSPPRSWRSPPSPSVSIAVKPDADVPNTPAWRADALSLLFSTFISPPSSSERHTPSRPVHPDPGDSPIPPLTLLCLQLIRAVCPGAELARVAPYVPPHLRRALVRYAAVHAPLSQVELDALRVGAAHVDTELIVVGPWNSLRRSFFRNRDHADGRRGDVDADTEDEDDRDPGPGPSCTVPGGDTDEDAWDAVQMQDTEPLVLRSLAVLSSPLSAVTLLAFPPTITHLALIDIPCRIPLQRLPTICPLLIFLDLSYNAWLRVDAAGREASILEEMEWGKLRSLEVVGLRRCTVTPKVLLELNRGRWEDIEVIQ